MHFFSPANVMKLLEVVRGAEDRQGRAGDVDAAGQEDQQDGGGLRRLRRLHRQPHDRAVLCARRASCSRRARRRSRSTSALEKFGMAMGPFRMGDLAGNDIGWAIRKRRYVEKPACRVLADRRPAVRAGPLRPEDRRRLVRLRSRASATRSRSSGRRDDRGASRRDRHHAAQDRRRGDRRALRLRAGQRGRAHPRGGHRPARVRHRHGLPHRLRLPAVPRRADALRRHASGLFNVDAPR